MSETTPSSAPADSRESNPGPLFEAHYRSLWECEGSSFEEANPALAVEAIGFTRYAGDWLGVIVTPWFLRLYLVPGGGSLWGEIPLGRSRYINLPSETMQFVADADPELGPFQFSTLIDPTSLLSDMGAARQMALRIMQPFAPPAPEAAPPTLPETPEARPGVTRRGFFRRLAGKR